MHNHLNSVEIIETTRLSKRLLKINLICCSKTESPSIFSLSVKKHKITFMNLRKIFVNSFNVVSFHQTTDIRQNSIYLFRDNWGRKWCHLVAMDAVCFRDRTAQYKLECVDRELLKAYTSFYLRKTGQRSEVLPGIVTGSWGCGAFNGDKELKGTS